MADETEEHFPYALIDANGNVEISLMMTDLFADTERARLQDLGYQDIIKIEPGALAVNGQPFIPAAEAAVKKQIAAAHEATQKQLSEGVEWPADSGQFLQPNVGQITLSALAQAAASGALLDSRFPLPWPVGDGSTFYSFPNAADVAAMYAAVVNRAADLLVDLQTQVEQALSPTEVLADP